MPLYEYTCQDCHQKFEVLRSFSETSESSPSCEHCASPNTERNLGSLLAVFGSSGQGKVSIGGSSCGSCSSVGSSACGTCSGGR